MEMEEVKIEDIEKTVNLVISEKGSAWFAEPKVEYTVSVGDMQFVVSKKSLYETDNLRDKENISVVEIAEDITREADILWEYEEEFWATIDRIIKELKKRGIVVIPKRLEDC